MTAKLIQSSELKSKREVNRFNIVDPAKRYILKNTKALGVFEHLYFCERPEAISP
jgi:hypothetical protein